MYSVIQPYHMNFLQVDARHHIYFEEVGNPRGYPVVFVHGGPGGGIFPNCRRFFDPKHYRIILFDQRGAGKSRPYADLVDNTTAHLISDMEYLREYLNIDKWMVFGGSWAARSPSPTPSPIQIAFAPWFYAAYFWPDKKSWTGSMAPKGQLECFHVNTIGS